MGEWPHLLSYFSSAKRLSRSEGCLKVSDVSETTFAGRMRWPRGPRESHLDSRAHIRALLRG